MAYDRCKTCGDFGFTDTHKCPPVHQCKGPDDDEWQDFHARSSEDAAIKWAERYDEGEYTLVRSRSCIEITVRAPNGAEEKFSVSGESQPVYSAYPSEDRP